MAKAAMTVIRGGRVLDIGRHAAPRADILVKGDTIVEIGRPGLSAPPTATVIDARDRLLHPGLVNGHTHSHGNLAKGMMDRITLELLLTASPYMSGARTLEDKYLSSLIGAAEMVLKGCTAAYDLAAEFEAMLKALGETCDVLHLSMGGPRPCPAVPPNVVVDELPMKVNRAARVDILLKSLLVFLLLPVAGRRGFTGFRIRRLLRDPRLFGGKRG